MDDDHIFIASGDSCPICSALNGTPVSAGYTAHANCHCNTVPRDEGGECEWDFTSTTHRDGSGPMDAIIEIDVTVTCPDGATVQSQTSVDAHSYGGSEAEFDRFCDDVHEAAEDQAQRICDSCPPKVEKPVS
jgi:hypothetical protein